MEAPFTKAIFLCLLLAGCSSDSENTSDDNQPNRSAVIADDSNYAPAYQAPTSSDINTPMTMSERARLAFPPAPPGGYTSDGGSYDSSGSSSYSPSYTPSYTPSSTDYTPQYQHDRAVNESNRVLYDNQRQQTFYNRRP